MTKNVQNTLIFVLLIIGLVTFIVDVWSGDGETSSEDPEKEEVDSWFHDAPQPTMEPIDVDALREEIRAELLAELKADVPVLMPEPIPVVSEKVLPTPVPTRLPIEESPPAEVVPEEKPEVLATSEPTVDLAAMTASIEMLEGRVNAMKQYLREEDRVLNKERDRILRWRRDLQTKYEDELFSVTKTRAEQRRVQLAEAAWRSRHYRQQVRSGILVEAEEELARRKELLREAKRR